MNKQEFKEMYAAARLIRGAANAKSYHSNAGTDKAWGICHDVINAMHPAVSSAVWGWLKITADTEIYKPEEFKQHRWMMDDNSRKFGAVECRSRGTL